METAGDGRVVWSVRFLHDYCVFFLNYCFTTNSLSFPAFVGVPMYKYAGKHYG